MAIRDANRPTSALIGGGTGKVRAVAGWEAEAFSWRSDCWTVVLGDKAPAPMRDGGCLSEDAVGVLDKSCPAVADSCMLEGATWPTCCTVHEVGRVALPSDPTDCTARNGELYASATAAASRLLEGA